MNSEDSAFKPSTDNAPSSEINQHDEDNQVPSEEGKYFSLSQLKESLELHRVAAEL